jgi:hypothetical protein
MRTGSHRNAEFKGQHRKEYAWFSIGGALPMVSMSAEKAARQILRACQNGDGEVLVRNPTDLLITLPQLMPGLASEILAIVNRWLPGMGGIGQRSARGYESQSYWSPSLITRRSELAAVRNNEMRERT